MDKVSFKYERQIWRRDFKVVAGCDEVGRGCFAGPVVTGCVVFTPNITLQGRTFKGVK
ncbi:MAG: ribonuclease HII, ribonuclease HII, partial [Microgenomates group bacterium GW2011_GWC1_37_8]